MKSAIINLYRGSRIVVITPASQAGNTGSIPACRLFVDLHYNCEHVTLHREQPRFWGIFLLRNQLFLKFCSSCNVNNSNLFGNVL